MGAPSTGADSLECCGQAGGGTNRHGDHQTPERDRPNHVGRQDYQNNNHIYENHIYDNHIYINPIHDNYQYLVTHTILDELTSLTTPISPTTTSSLNNNSLLTPTSLVLSNTSNTKAAVEGDEKKSNKTKLEKKKTRKDKQNEKEREKLKEKEKKKEKKPIGANARVRAAAQQSGRGGGRGGGDDPLMSRPRRATNSKKESKKDKPQPQIK